MDYDKNEIEFIWNDNLWNYTSLKNWDSEFEKWVTFNKRIRYRKSSWNKEAKPNNQFNLNEMK